MLVSFRMGVCGMIGDVDVDTHTYNLYHVQRRLNHKLLVPGFKFTQSLFLFCGDICFMMRSWAT